MSAFLHARVYIPSTRIKNTICVDVSILTCAWCSIPSTSYQEHNMRYVTFLHVHVVYSIYTYQEHNMRYVTFLHARVYIPSTRMQEHNMRYVS